jgi:hypothetical protein
MKSNLLNECIIVSTEMDDKFILAKNRDRAYKPQLEIIHEIIDGVEVVYLHDMITDWSEGLNEFGIGAVNAALAVGHDEIEKKVVKKKGKPGKDGLKMRHIISRKTLTEAVNACLHYKGASDKALNGHTFISNPKKMVSVEVTSKHKPVIKIQNIEQPHVRTNHGHSYQDAGYTNGESYKSSVLRKISAEKQLKKIDSWYGIPKSMRTDYYEKHSPFDTARDTEKMFTSSQLVMNLTDKVFFLTYFSSKVEKFNGIVNKLPKGYKPKIKIIVEQLEDKTSKKPISIKRFL